ncbi:hypothetical protein [Paraburkholderia kirstenboschensis]|uniref:hypothetical protein n=1 Tax=Paraburkholderia kirstenboschensis TaxID=1245436 RepID=UPI003743B6DB
MSATQAATELAVAGRPSQVLMRRRRRYSSGQGLSQHVRHRTGHGMGHSAS